MASPTRQAFLASLTSAPELEGRYEDPANDRSGCGICYGPFTDAVRAACNPPHGHLFCRACLTLWLHTGNNCPICRFVFFPESPRPQQGVILRLRIFVTDRGVFALLPPSPTASHQRATLVRLHRPQNTPNQNAGPFDDEARNTPRPQPVVFGPPRPPAMRQVYIGQGLQRYLSFLVIMRLGFENDPHEVASFLREIWTAMLAHLRTWLDEHARETMQVGVMREQLQASLAAATDQRRDARMTAQIVQRVENDRAELIEELIEGAVLEWEGHFGAVGNGHV